MKLKKQGRSQGPRALFSIAWRVISFTLALWVCIAGLVTETVATELMRQMEYEAQQYACADAAGITNFVNIPGDQHAMPGYVDACRIAQTTELYTRLKFDFSPSFPLFARPLPGKVYISDDYWMDYDFAIIFSDSAGNTLQQSGNYLYFPYMSAEDWAADSQSYEGFAYIDMEALGYGSTFYKYGFVQNARFTGYFEGNQFIPSAIDLVSGPEYEDPQWRNKLSFKNDYTGEIDPDRETVTIYTGNLTHVSYGYSDGFHKTLTVDNVRYDDLRSFLQQDRHPYEDYRSGSIVDATVVAHGSYVDLDGQYIRVTVGLHAQPLAFTMQKLAPFYLYSFLILAVAVLLFLLRVRRQLIKPVQDVAYWSTGKLSPLPMGGKPRWHEPRLLQENYTAAQQAAQSAATEITRLRTALEYSQNAEEHRRKMISNITHELKTPLAVIHSYAEGLRDGIAADKQEQYLGIILEETERMDAMVLEMLDLSRLEAGKVRLASDQFSVLSLTRSIFEKLEPLSTARDLQIEFDLVEEFEITADESRIGQVITNFASNAIKYTPEGGRIWVKVYRHMGKAIFSIENQCEPLSEEALSHVWDSFYRAEQSRTTKGTGLGLTIAKAIIELHGGTCHATRTSEGIEFRFTLP